MTGAKRPLPAAVELTAYRIVQESLTNTIRHAGRATAALSLAYLDTELLVEVTDTGLGYPGRGRAPGAGRDRGTRSLRSRSPGAGHGLAGMRERAATVGRARCEAGPLAASGFRVDSPAPRPRVSPGQVQPGSAGGSKRCERGRTTRPGKPDCAEAGSGRVTSDGAPGPS